MVMPVMRRPPQHALLAGRHCHKGDKKLKDSAGLVGAMRKIPMISGGNEEHSCRNQRQAADQIHPAEFHQENRERQNVHRGEW
jgi:hypothetical protein